MIFARAALSFLIAAGAVWAAEAPIPVADLGRSAPVDFDREVRPFLSDNCFSCHSQTTTKGGLNLETPELMVKGGDSGAAIVPKNAGESLVMEAAAHRDSDLIMPPSDNKAKAKDLTSEQLGLLRLWIDQGAVASPKRERTIAWQPLPETVGAILAVAITKDGQFAACARGNRIFIYHLPSGRLVANESAHLDQVNALAFSPDGLLMASAGYREVKLWRRVEPAGKSAPTASVSVESPACGRVDGNVFAVLDADGNAAAQVDHGAPITAFAVRGDRQRFATAGGNYARLWAADGRQVGELRGNRYARELVGERDRALQVETGNSSYRKEMMQAAETAFQTAQGRAKKSGEAIGAKQQELEAKQKALADATAAKTAADQALADAEAELKRADAAVQAAAKQGEEVVAATIAALKGAEPVDANQRVTGAAAALQEASKARIERDQREAQRKQTADKIPAAGELLSKAGTAMKMAETAKAVADKELELAKAEEQKKTASVAEAKAAIDATEARRKRAEEALQSAREAAVAAEQPVRAIAFSPDGSTVAAAGDDQLIHTASAESGAPFEVLKGHSTAVNSLAFTPNGELVSTASDGAIMVWNLTPEWKFERTIGASDGSSALTDRVNALAFSHDGKQLATGSGEPSRGGEIKIWNVADGGLAREFTKVHSDAVLGLEFSPDDQLLASGAADKMARVIDLASGNVVRNFEGHAHHVLGVAWSADGRTLATAGADRMVKVWDFPTGEKKKKNLEGYEKEVTAVRFVGVSANLLTSSGDNKVRLVDLEGKEVRAFAEVADFMQSAAVSADGTLVIAGGGDGVLRVWNAHDGAKVATFDSPDKAD